MGGCQSKVKTIKRRRVKTSLGGGPLGEGFWGGEPMRTKKNICQGMNLVAVMKTWKKKMTKWGVVVAVYVANHYHLVGKTGVQLVSGKVIFFLPLAMYQMVRDNAFQLSRGNNKGGGGKLARGKWWA